MKTSGIVTLLTDFGVHEPFVGVMKGVLLAHCRTATLVDLTHAVEPGRVADAAFWLAQAYPWFPAGTVHLAVVDPGVGTTRAPLAVLVGDHVLVGPDNGLFEVVLRRAASFEARRIDAGRLGLSEPSRTFHGRDVFAPAAGALASGALGFEELGPVHAPLVTQAVPEPRRLPNGVEGEVLVVDRFGNLVTNVDRSLFPEDVRASIEVAGRSLALVGTYGDVAPGECAAVTGSFGQLELVERDGSAARALGAARGTPLKVHWSR